MLTGGVAGSVFASPPTCWFYYQYYHYYVFYVFIYFFICFFFPASILAGIRAVGKDNPGLQHFSVAKV